MIRTILKFGAIAGTLVGLALVGIGLGFEGQVPPAWGMALGYATMLVALSAVFVGIKHHRDRERGGVIRFWPALGVGLAISAVASLFYVVAWEVVRALAENDFAEVYTQALIAQQQAKGLAGAELAAYAASLEAFKADYANWWFRLPMSFIEIFPVGVLVSLVSAALLRNPRVLPATR